MINPARRDALGRVDVGCPHGSTGCDWGWSGWSSRAALIEQQLHGYLCRNRPLPTAPESLSSAMCRYDGCTWHMVFPARQASTVEILRREHEYREHGEDLSLAPHR